VRLKPDYGGAYFNLGVDYLKDGNKKLAAEQYEKLRTLNPNNAKILYTLIYKKEPPK
jgi:Flp pilus assembly protein TadD